MKKKILITLLVLLILPCVLVFSACGDDDNDDGDAAKLTIAEFREMIDDSGLWGTDIHIMDNNQHGSSEAWFNGSGDDVRMKIPATPKMINTSITTAYTHYGKIGNDYYEVTTYEGPNPETHRIEILLTEYVKLTKNECLNIIKNKFDSYFSGWNDNLREDLENKEEFINLYGEENYYYRESINDSTQCEFKIEMSSFDNYEFENIQIGVNPSDIKTYNVPTDVVYSFQYDIEARKFISFCGNINIKDGYDFNGDGTTCVINASINISYDPSTLTFTMPTFDVDADNEDKDVDISEVNGDEKISVSYRNCTSLASGLATPFEDFALPTPTCQGNYTFDGWYDYYGNKYEGSLNLSRASNSIILYAKWKNAVDPIINLNGGTLISKPTGKIFVVDYYPDIEVFKPGYTLQGWKDANGNHCSNAYATQINSSYTMNAQWKKNTTINFEVNGAAEKVGTINTLSGINVVLPSNLNKANKIFAGWYTEPTFINNVSLNYVVPENDITLYAKFDDAFILTVYDLVESVCDYVIPRNGDYDDFKDLYSNIIKTQKVDNNEGQYSFGGWYINSIFLTPFTSYPTSNLVIYAKKVPTWYIKYDFIGDYAETFENTYGTNGTFDVVKDGELYYNNMNPACDIILNNLFDIGNMNDQNSFYISLTNLVLSAFDTFSCHIDGIYLDADKTQPLFSEDRDSAQEVLAFWQENFEGPLTLYFEMIPNEQP